MADANLVAWSKDFLKAVAKLNSAITSYNLLVSRSQFGFAPQIAQQSVKNAITELLTISNKLPSVLTSKNKEKAISSLNAIVDKISSISVGARGPIKNSYFKELSEWYVTYIKSLV